MPAIAHTVHGWGFTPETPRPLRRLYIELERRAARGCTRIIFVNPADREEGERLGILPAGSGCDLLPGIDLVPYLDEDRMVEHRRRVRREFGIDEDTLLGGFLGRLAPQKDPQMVLEVARFLHSRHPRLRWLMVGDGPLAAELKSASGGDSTLSGLILWAGPQDHPAPFLAAMDFLLFPSRWEGTPLTLMEALSAGLPVVASDLPGIRFLLAPAANGGDGSPPWGHLVRPGNLVEFATRVSEICSDRSLRQHMKEDARRHALGTFGVSRMLAGLLAVYGLDG